MSFLTEICRWKNNNKAALTFTFDGCYKATFDLVSQSLLEYGYPSTWFIVTGFVGKSIPQGEIAPWDTWKSASSMNMEIGSHTITHPTLRLSKLEAGFKIIRFILKSPRHDIISNSKINKMYNLRRTYQGKRRGSNPSLIIDEAFQSKRIIADKIPNQDIVSFAYPGGRYNLKLKRGIKRAGYLSARTTEDGYNYQESIDYYALKSKVWTNDVNLKYANRWIDDAIIDNSWLIETFHIISKNGDSGYIYDIPYDIFSSHIKYIKLKSIWVDTQHNIIKYIKERSMSKVKVDASSNVSVLISIENDLRPFENNQVLTLRTRIPNDWSTAEIEQAKSIELVSAIRENNINYIYYNVIPCLGNIVLTKAR